MRLGARRRLVLAVTAGADGGVTAGAEGGRPSAPWMSTRGGAGLPVLPDAATWVLPDLALLRSGLITPDRLHHLVASALVPGHATPTSSTTADRPALPRLVDGVLAALDHGPAEIRREELLAALTGTPLPCLRASAAGARATRHTAEQRASSRYGSHFPPDRVPDSPPAWARVVTIGPTWIGRAAGPESAPR